jgi:hypothetical protein
MESYSGKRTENGRQPNKETKISENARNRERKEKSFTSENGNDAVAEKTLECGINDELQ